MALIKYNKPSIVAKPPVNRPVYSTAPMAPVRPQVADTTGEEAPLTNQDVISIILASSKGSGGGGTFTGETKPQRLAREAAARGSIAQANYLNTQLAQTPEQFKALMAGLPAVYDPARTATQTSYDTALKALQGRRTNADTLAGQGRTALGDYLRTNVPTAYASLPNAQAPTLAPNAIAQYAQAIGVPTESIGQAAAQSAVEAQGAGGNYDRLLNILRAAETSGQASRGRELEMLGNVQNANIEQLYGAGSQQLEATRQAGLNQIASQQASQLFAIQQAQAAREQSIRDALAAIYASGNLSYALPQNQTSVLPDLSGVDWNALGRLMGGR